MKNRVRSLLAALVVLPFGLVVGGCIAFPHVANDEHFSGQEWTQLALTFDGPKADGERVRECMREAREAGIRLTPTAQAKATVFFSDQENWVQIEGQPQRWPLGKWTVRQLCRVAVGKAVDLDNRVRVVKGEPPPGECQQLGSVSGTDRGFMFYVLIPAIYEAAVTEAQFRALRMGANLLVVDIAQSVYLNLTVNGRIFRCGASAPPPPPPPPPAG